MRYSDSSLKFASSILTVTSLNSSTSLVASNSAFSLDSLYLSLPDPQNVMAEYEESSELDDSISTISVDSATYNNLAVSQNLSCSQVLPSSSRSAENGGRQRKRTENIPHDQVFIVIKCI